MPLITRCPSCQTAFQVTQSQLAQASGWVRCGRCDKIFDGAAHMVNRADDQAPTLQPVLGEVSETAEPSPASAASAVAPDAPPQHRVESESDPDPGTPDLGMLTPAKSPVTPAFSEPTLAHPDVGSAWDDMPPAAADDDGPTEPTLDPIPAPAVPAPDMEDAPDLGALNDGAANAAVEPPAAQEATEAQGGAEEEPSDPPSQAADSDAPESDAPGSDLPEPADTAERQTSDDAAPADEPASPLDAESADAGEVDRTDAAPALHHALPHLQTGAFPAATAAAAAEPSFVARARRRALWNHGLVRGGLWLLALLLAVTLAGQWALAERDRLAAEHPRWAPALEALCGALNCTVRAYRNLEALAITSSSLKRLDDDAFEFDVGLRNRSGVAVAVPALELTLTDLSERILVRRVIQPTELDAPDRLAAHGQWQGEHALVLDPNAGAAGVVNYKLQMFYP